MVFFNSRQTDCAAQNLLCQYNIICICIRKKRLLVTKILAFFHKTDGIKWVGNETSLSKKVTSFPFSMCASHCTRSPFLHGFWGPHTFLNHLNHVYREAMWWDFQGCMISYLLLLKCRCLLQMVFASCTKRSSVPFSVRCIWVLIWIWFAALRYISLYICIELLGLR